MIFELNIFVKFQLTLYSFVICYSKEQGPQTAERQQVGSSGGDFFSL